MVLDPIPQMLPVHFFGSRPQPPTSPSTAMEVRWIPKEMKFLFFFPPISFASVREKRHVKHQKETIHMSIFFWKKVTPTLVDRLLLRDEHELVSLYRLLLRDQRSTRDTRDDQQELVSLFTRDSCWEMVSCGPSFVDRVLSRDLLTRHRFL